MRASNSDEKLVAAALGGSARAWRQLVQRHEGRIYNLGYRLTGNSEDALDLLQEVFLGVYRNLERFRGEANFSTWLFRIAHNKAVDFNRKRKLLSLTGNLDDSGEFAALRARAETEPEYGAGERDRNRLALQLLSRIPMEQRLVVELKIYQSLTFEEIASMQEISVNTAKTRFYAALKKMRWLPEEENALLEN